jgi:type I restriction enzyme, S subunit
MSTHDLNANRPGYKETKVGWIPEEWDAYRAADYLPFVTSGSRGWAEFYSDEGDLFLRITNLVRDTPKPNLKNRKNVTLPSANTEGRRTRLLPNDLVVSITADPGIVSFIDENFPSPAYISQHLALLRFPDSSKVSAQYVAYALSTERLRNHFEKITDQGAKAGLNLDAIRSLPINAPPLPEQKKLAEILSTCDEVIEKAGALIEAKKRQKKALMQQLLSGEKRLPGFGEEWEEVALSEISKRLKKTTTDPDGYPVLSITAGRGYVSQADKFSRIIAGKQVEKYVILKRGEFSYNKGNSYRYPQGCVYRLTEYDRGLVPNVFYSFRLNETRADAEFIKQYFLAGLHNGDLYRWINSGVRNNGLLNLNAADFFKLPIKLPPLSEQAAIGEILRHADGEVQVLEAKFAALKQQKKALMQQLLTGHLRVKV